MDNIVPAYYIIHASSKQRKFFATYDNSPVITATANRSSELAPSLWHGSSSPICSDRHALISVLTSYCRFDVEIHAEGHHFHAGNCRGCAQNRDLVAKIKIAKFFSWHVGDSRKFVLAKISRYTVSIFIRSTKNADEDCQLVYSWNTARISESVSIKVALFSLRVPLFPTLINQAKHSVSLLLLSCFQTPRNYCFNTHRVKSRESLGL